MVDKKVAQAAAQAASCFIENLIASPPAQQPGEMQATAYYVALQELIKQTDISPQEFERRIDRYAVKMADSENQVGSIRGNLLKESERKAMGQKIFLKLVEAVFSPDESLGIRRVI